MRIFGVLAVLLVALILVVAIFFGIGDDDAAEETPTPVAEATPTVDLVTEDSDFDEYADVVVERVIELRGLEMLEEIDVQLLDRDQLRDRLEENVEVEQSELDLYWMLRLIDDRQINLEQLLIELQAEELVGYYDHDTGETIIVSEYQELSPWEEIILAHEIVHALQDQHFDLKRVDDWPTDYDREMAFRSVVEGDAVLVQELYRDQYFTEEDFSELQPRDSAVANTGEQLAFAQSRDQLPRYFIDRFEFPYTAGVEFVIEVYYGSGEDFSAVNEVLENPPVSTRQILDPENALSGAIDNPVDIDMPDFADQLPDQWEESLEGALGMLDLIVMLEENGLTDGWSAVGGWAGTGFTLYENGDDLLSVLATRWETDDDAAQFADALVETMVGYDEDDGIWRGDDRYHTIVFEDDSVNLKSSTDPEALDALITPN